MWWLTTCNHKTTVEQSKTTQGLAKHEWVLMSNIDSTCLVQAVLILLKTLLLSQGQLFVLQAADNKSILHVSCPR